MRFLRWFETAEGARFAAQVASDYDKLRRSVVLRGDDPAKQARKFEKLASRVEEFQRTHRLNFYQKARMLDELKKGLTAFGIDEAEISAFLKTLLIKGLPTG